MPTPEVPPYIQWIDRWGIGGADQYNRFWEWHKDADGNSKLGYRDADGRLHETYKGSDGFWYETFTDKDGNTHLGQVDDAGNVHDGWTDASGFNYDQVRPPEEIIGREQSSGASSLVEEVPPVGQQPEAEPPVQPNPPAEPPVEQSPTPNPPAVPGGEGGISGMGVPYQDFIPLYPMDQDPATGEWRNTPPGEIPKPEPLPPSSPADDFEFDETGTPIDISPGESQAAVQEDLTPAPDAIEDVIGGPTFAPGTASDVPGGAEQQQPPQGINPNLLDPIPSSGPSPFGPPPSPPSDEGEYEEQDVAALQFGNTGNFNNTPDYQEAGQPPPGEPGGETPPQGIDPNLLDPIAPGATLDTGLVPRIEGNPALVNAVNQDPTVAEALERDPTQIDQIEQDLSVAEHQRPMEPSGAAESTGDSGPRFTDPSLTEQPPPEPSMPDDGADDVTL